MQQIASFTTQECFSSYLFSVWRWHATRKKTVATLLYNFIAAVKLTLIMPNASSTPSRLFACVLLHFRNEVQAINRIFRVGCIFRHAFYFFSFRWCHSICIISYPPPLSVSFSVSENSSPFKPSNILSS